MSLFVQSTSKPQRDLVENDIKQRKTGNPHCGEAGASEYLEFLTVDKWFIVCQNCWRFIFCRLTNVPAVDWSVLDHRESIKKSHNNPVFLFNTCLLSSITGHSTGALAVYNMVSAWWWGLFFSQTWRISLLLWHTHSYRRLTLLIQSHSVTSHTCGDVITHNTWNVTLSCMNCVFAAGDAWRGCPPPLLGGTSVF